MSLASDADNRLRGGRGCYKVYSLFPVLSVPVFVSVPPSFPLVIRSTGEEQSLILRESNFFVPISVGFVARNQQLASAGAHVSAGLCSFRCIVYEAAATSA